MKLNHLTSFSLFKTINKSYRVWFDLGKNTTAKIDCFSVHFEVQFILKSEVSLQDPIMKIILYIRIENKRTKISYNKLLYCLSLDEI